MKTEVFYSWDFDENLIYIFEVKSPKNIDDDTFVKTPFSKKYKLIQKFHESISMVFSDIQKEISESANLEVIYYSFKDKPVDCGLYCEFKINKKIN